MRGCVGEASSSMDTAHSQRTKSTDKHNMLAMSGKKRALEERVTHTIRNTSSVPDLRVITNITQLDWLHLPIAFPSSLVDPVNILKQKHTGE